MLDKILIHGREVFGALDVLLIPGLFYAAVRGRKHLKGVRYGVLVASFVCVAYVVLFAITATGWTQERYYRPIIPFATLVAALGYYCFALDVRRKDILYPLLGVVALACAVDVLHKPLRAHRQPQVEAGLWLKRHDPDYEGFVVSEYTIPVLYAEMKYFDPHGARKLFKDLKSHGYLFKYIILDGDAKGQWYRKYALKHDWSCIYREPERNIRIYKNPELQGGPDGTAKASRVKQKWKSTSHIPGSEKVWRR